MNQQLRDKLKTLPLSAGVYFHKSGDGEIIYVGKATSLARRVRQHFERPHSNFIEEMTRLVTEIDYIQKPTALEALILEANLIKLYWPKYNTDQKDDKSFMYLAITDEEYPRPLLVRGGQLGVGKTIVGVLSARGHSLDGLDRKGSVLTVGDHVPRAIEHRGGRAERAELRYKYLFGPYTSARSLRVALELIRKIIPWSTCVPGQKRACFYFHLKQCPGVCVEAVTPLEYRRVIRDLIRFFEGKKEDILKDYRKRMQRAAKAQQFEEAGLWRNKVFALEHIQDVSMLSKEDEVQEVSSIENRVSSTDKDVASSHIHDTGYPIPDTLIFGRIEGYDISHVSGTSTVASMVVFERGAANKGEYRKFRIKTVEGSNDVASMQEVLRRRFTHAEWKRPHLLLIDGGVPQVQAAEQVVRGELGLSIPIVGLAKGSERKRNDLIFTTADALLAQACQKHHVVLEQVRDEAHRFAITYHRNLRGRRFLGDAKRLLDNDPS
jgi:excinuclease ABC subunit C